MIGLSVAIVAQRMIPAGPQSLNESIEYCFTSYMSMDTD